VGVGLEEQFERIHEFAKRVIAKEWLERVGLLVLLIGLPMISAWNRLQDFSK
jgi:hypothetical protein